MGVQTTDFVEMARGLRLIGADYGRAVDILNDAYAATHRGELPPLEAVPARPSRKPMELVMAPSPSTAGRRSEPWIWSFCGTGSRTGCMRWSAIWSACTAPNSPSRRRGCAGGRKAEILREYADPEGPHVAAGGVKALGSNEEGSPRDPRRHGCRAGDRRGAGRAGKLR